MGINSVGSRTHHHTVKGPYWQNPSLQWYGMATDGCFTILYSSIGRNFIQTIAHVRKLHL